MDKNKTNAMMNYSIDDNLNIGITQVGFPKTTANYTCWDYWSGTYYPDIIRESYPVYIRAIDNGKKAFEIIKMLKDKRFVKLETVGDFIDCMDTLIKIL